jgi:hypothetical protein
LYSYHYTSITTQYNVVHCVFTLPLSLSYSSALYTIYLTWYQSHLSCGLQYSGTPASSSALHPAAALFRPTAPSMRYSRSSFGTPSDGRPSPANHAANSSGNFCPSLSRRHRHPSRPKEPPKVVSKPRIGGSVQSQPIPALHAHYTPHQTTDQTLRVQIRRDHHRPSFHAPTRAPRRICPFADALHAPPMVIHALPRALEPSARLPTRFTRSHAPPMVIHALTRALEPFCPFADALHALPRATHEIHAPPRAPTRSGTFWRVRSTRHIILPRPRAYWRVRYTLFLHPHALRVTHTRQAFFFQATRLLAREMHAPFSKQLWRVLYTRQALLITTCCHVSFRERHVSPSSATCHASQKKKKKKKLIRIQYFRPDPTG